MNLNRSAVGSVGRRAARKRSKRGLGRPPRRIRVRGDLYVDLRGQVVKGVSPYGCLRWWRRHGADVLRLVQELVELQEGHFILLRLIKAVTYSVTSKKSPNVYKSCPKMISPEK